MPVIQLMSSEGKIFNVDSDILKCASNIMWVIEHYEVDSPFPLPRVSSMILEKIITWATYHKDDPVPMMDEQIAEITGDNIDAWDVEFLNTNLTMLDDILMGANCLGIRVLSKTCKAVALMGYQDDNDETEEEESNESIEISDEEGPGGPKGPEGP